VFLTARNVFVCCVGVVGGGGGGGGGVAILSVASCYRNWDNLRPCGPPWPVCDFTILKYSTYVNDQYCLVTTFSMGPDQSVL